ncbi:MAG: ribonuclease Z [Gammaproteobacteria bacterium]|jgi:ribonuclease Z
MRFFLIPILLMFASPIFADVMRVTILGSGTPRPDINRFSQSILVEAGDEKLLFDAGRGATIRLSQAGINIKDINKVFLTHLHSDHTLGLSDLIMTGWIYQRSQDFQIFGPAGTKDFVKNIKLAFFEDIKIRTVAPENHTLEGLSTPTAEIEEGLVYKKNGVEVIAFRVDHGGGVEHAFGYKIIYNKKVVVISGDTNYSDNLIKYAKNCDLLIHEIADAPLKVINNNARVQGLMNYHTTPSEMAKVINAVNPKFTILTHILALGGISISEIHNKVLSSVNKDYQVEMAYDLMAIDVKENIQTYSVDYSNEK